jgi:hypothetical protein
MESSYRQRLEEIDKKYSKPEKRKKKKKQKSLPKPGGLNGILQGFNEKPTKGNVQNTVLKTVADLAGVGIGTTVSAAAGTVAPLIGAALIGAGHYIGDDSGLLRVVGAATVAHSVAKSKEYRQEGSTMKDRLLGLKDDWLRAALLKHDQETNLAISPIQEPGTSPLPTIPEIPSQPVIKRKEPALQPIHQNSQPERRKTLYELEIVEKQRRYEAEAEELRLEMEQADLESQEQSQQTELDMSGFDEIEQYLYGSAKNHLQDRNLNRESMPFDDNISLDEIAVDDTLNDPGESDYHKPIVRLWPPDNPTGFDEDDFGNDELDFANY